jgi:hypothetical protein
MNALELEVSALQNNIWQVEGGHTVWFQGSLLECEAFKAKALSEWYESIKRGD